MPRAKKDGKYVNIYMDRMILDAMDIFSAETHIPKTAIIEEGVKLYLKKNGVKIEISTKI